jgi:hypothetical protein
MMKITLSIALVLCLVMDSVSAMCPDVENPVYFMEKLPYTCFPAFAECPTQMCECVGMTYDETKMECVRPNRRSSSPLCTKVGQCVASYIECVNSRFTAAADDGSSTNCTDDTEKTAFTFFHTQALLSVVNPSGYNDTDLFASCGRFLCQVGNATGCSDAEAFSANELCVAPFGFSVPITPKPGTTPAPTNPDGSFAVPTKIVSITLVFAADFDRMMETETKKQQIKDATSESLTNKLNYKTVVRRFTYKSTTGAITTASRLKHALAAAELSVTGEATVAASDTSTLGSLLANVESLKKDTSTGWLSALSNVAGFQVPAPTVTSAVRDGNQPSSSAAACGTGCVAGVVVGGVVAVTVGVGAVAYVSMKKSAAVAPDPQK